MTDETGQRACRVAEIIQYPFKFDDDERVELLTIDYSDSALYPFKRCVFPERTVPADARLADPIRFERTTSAFGGDIDTT